MLSLVLLVAAAASQVSAVTHRIDVGKGLVFTPNSITAAVGDVLEYHFLGGVHDVARGDFGSACTPSASGGFYSGVFRPQGGEAPEVFRVTVTSTEPIFYYCSVAGHCSGGMVGVVNPTSGQTLEAYTNAASSAIEVAPPAVFGGTLGPAGGSSSSPGAAPAPGAGPAPAPASGPAVSDAPSGAAPAPTGSASGSAARAPTASAGNSASSARPSQPSASSVAVSAAGAPKVASVGILGAAALAMFFY